MRPIPAPRLGHAHGLLRALEQRGKLRLDEFITEFSEDELFPSGLENATGRTRQFVSFARAAGLVKEERGSVELTDLGKRYMKAYDRQDVFQVSGAQAEWLRRQLLEKHLTESIWMGAAIGLSLYATLPPGERISSLDFGRAAAHLGRAGWDNDNTFQSQGERYTAFLRDLELIDDGFGLTPIGEEIRNELQLPVHAAVLDVAEQLHPDGADGVRAAAAEEFPDSGDGDVDGDDEAATAAEPEAEAALEEAEDAADEDEGGDTYETMVGNGAPAATPAMGPIEAAALAAAQAAGESPAGAADIDPSSITKAPDGPAKSSGDAVEEPVAAGDVAADAEAASGEAAAGEAASGEAAADAAGGAASEASAEDAPPPVDAVPPPPTAAGIDGEVDAGAAGGEPVTAPSDSPPAEPAGSDIPNAVESGDAGGVEVVSAEDFEQPAPDGPVLPAPAEGTATSGGAMDTPDIPSAEPDEPTVPIPAIRPTSAIRALRPEDLAAYAATGAIPSEEIDEPASPAEAKQRAAARFLDPAQVREIAERRGLKLDPGVYGAAIAALASGRHLVLTGQPGSGKTSLALAIAEAAVKQGRCGSVTFTSAGSLGGFDAYGRPGADGSFEPGVVPQAIKDNKWLIVDELDRVPLDDALGRLSTVLGGHPVELPGGAELKPSDGWRVVATMQDISGVATTSMALRRRFVFIEVPVLEHADLEALVDSWTEDDETARAVGRRLVAVNDAVPLGPGLVKDAIAYVKERRTLAPAGEVDLTLEALAGFVLPQLEGQGDEVAMRAVRAAGI